MNTDFKKSRLHEVTEKIISRAKAGNSEEAVKSMIKEFTCEVLTLYYNIQITSLVGKDLDTRMKDFEDRFGIKEPYQGKFF
jgi:hypothetical protein